MYHQVLTDEKLGSLQQSQCSTRCGRGRLTQIHRATVFLPFDWNNRQQLFINLQQSVYL